MKFVISIDRDHVPRVSTAIIWNMPTALVIGASRGLGYELTIVLHADGYRTFGTTRSSDSQLPHGVERISPIDIAHEDAGAKIAVALGETKLDVVIVNAGVFRKEVCR